MDVPIPSWADIDPTARFPPPAGQPLRDEYMQFLAQQNVHFMDHLGSGGFGAVWRATILRPNAQNMLVHMIVAVKVMSLYVLQHRRLLTATNKMMREVSVIKELDHPHVIKLIDLIILEDINVPNVSYPYMHVLLFMELCDEDLHSLLIRMNRQMYEIEIYNWFVQVVDGLRYLHYDRRIAHMDIKPPNILIHYHPTLANHYLFKLADFGLSLTFDEGEFTARSRRLKGTPKYMAPEVVAQMLYDACIADVFSLAVTAIDCIVGWNPQLRNQVVLLISICLADPINYPNVNEQVVSTRLHMSIPLIRLLKGMLEADPTNRYDINRVYFHDWTSQRPYASGSYLQFWP